MKHHYEGLMEYLNAQASRRSATIVFSLRFQGPVLYLLEKKQMSGRTILSSHISLVPVESLQHFNVKQTECGI